MQDLRKRGKRDAHFGGMSKDKDQKEEGGTAEREEIRAEYYEKGDSGEKVLNGINSFTDLFSKDLLSKDTRKGRGKVGAVNKSRELVENIRLKENCIYMWGQVTLWPVMYFQYTYPVRVKVIIIGLELNIGTLLKTESHPKPKGTA